MRFLTRTQVRLPAFRLATLGGRSVALRDLLDGRSLLFYLWASWDPSRERLADLEAFHRESSRRVRVVSIAMDVQGPPVAMRYLRAARATHDALIDACCHLTRKWGVRRVPLAVAADPRATILRIGDDLDDELRTLLAAAGGVASEPEAPEETIEGPPIEFEVRVQECNVLLSRQRLGEAVGALRAALELDPENQILRRQILALLSPNRFYKGPIDTAWLAQQEKATSRRATRGG